MIRNIIEILSLDDFYGQSEIIEIAKGRYKFPENFKEIKRNIKRQVKWQLKGK